MNKIKKMLSILLVLMCFLLVACRQKESKYFGIINAIGFEMNGEVMYIKVSNETDEYSFVDQITVTDGATWELYSDISTTDKIVSKTITLSMGNNIAYILVRKADKTKLYHCIVNRQTLELSVKGYAVDVTLNDAGDMTIEETLTMNYPDNYHVIYKDIIYDKGPSTILTDKAYLDEDSCNVKVYDMMGELLTLASTVDCSDGEYWVGYSFNKDKDERGIEITCPPEITSKTSECDSIFVYLKDGMPSEITFKFTFTITGAVTVYNDVAQLYWTIIEFFDNEKIDAKVNINLPANTFLVEDYYLFGHGSCNITIDEIVENDKMSMSFDIDENDFIGLRLLTPVGLFPNAKEANIVAADKKASILEEESD